MFPILHEWVAGLGRYDSDWLGEKRSTLYKNLTVGSFILACYIICLVITNCFCMGVIRIVYTTKGTGPLARGSETSLSIFFWSLSHADDATSNILLMKSYEIFKITILGILMTKQRTRFCAITHAAELGGKVIEHKKHERHTSSGPN